MLCDMSALPLFFPHVDVTVPAVGTKPNDFRLMTGVASSCEEDIASMNPLLCSNCCGYLGDSAFLHLDVKAAFNSFDNHSNNRADGSKYFGLIGTSRRC